MVDGVPGVADGRFDFPGLCRPARGHLSTGGLLFRKWYADAPADGVAGASKATAGDGPAAPGVYPLDSD